MIRILRPFWPTLKYWFEVEVHVFGFSIAANVLLSFFPFLLVLVWFCRSIGWDSAEQAVYLAMGDLFGAEVEKLIRVGIDWIPARFKSFNFTSLFLLLFTANGIFEPMEVALNRCWGVHKHRSFLMNQLVSMGLIFACGSLVVLSIVLGALNYEFLKQSDGTALGQTMTWVHIAFYKLAAMPVLMLALFLIYWILPNTKVSWQRVVPIAIVVGVLLEGFKYLMKWIWPWFLRKVRIEYGPFYWAVIIVLVSFFAAMIVLAGAEWAARGKESPVEDPTPEPLPQTASPSILHPPHKS
ncbi:MAG TPA: YihY/virulence factor BrkB family protein [Bryobacteraceae bacterium]|nr:YihY/virulence factor BrkB family protein [Bryobacteraceae bacterium]